MSYLMKRLLQLFVQLMPVGLLWLELRVLRYKAR